MQQCCIVHDVIACLCVVLSVRVKTGLKVLVNLILEVPGVRKRGAQALALEACIPAIGPGYDSGVWRAGAKPNAATRLGGSTPLHRAAYMGHLSVAREL